MLPQRLSWGHRGWAKQASAFVDGELSPSALDRFERHVASCGRCHRAVEEMREAKLLVSRLPAVTSPRSFRLTPQMVAAPSRPRPASAARPQFVLRVAQTGAALAVVAFVAITVADLTHGGSTASDTTASLAAPESNSAGGAQAATARDSAKTTDGIAAPATTTPGVVPPSAGGVGGQSALCGPGSNATAPSAAGSSGAAAPTECPSPAPQPQAPAAGEAATPAAGPSEDASGSGNQTFAANGTAPETGHAQSPSDSSGEDWYRPAEFGTAAGAAVFALAAVALVLRRRRRA